MKHLISKRMPWVSLFLAIATVVVMALVIGEIRKVSGAGIVDAVPLGVSAEPMSEVQPPEQAEIAEITNTRVGAASIGVSVASSDKCAGTYGSITLDTGPTICLFTTNDLTTNAGSQVAVYAPSGLPGSRNTFIFAHNTAGLFSSLGGVKGFTIKVNGGETYNYGVVSSETVCDYSNTSKGHPCANYPNDPVLDMHKVMAPSRVVAGNAISLMTCAGQSIGDGDATHRLVVYAVQL